MINNIINFNKKNYINIFVILYLISYIAGPAIINIFVTLLSFFLYFIFLKIEKIIF